MLVVFFVFYLLNMHDMQMAVSGQLTLIDSTKWEETFYEQLMWLQPLQPLLLLLPETQSGQIDCVM